MTAAVDFPGLVQRFVAAQLAGNRAEALRLVVDEGVRRGARVVELQAKVIRPAQSEIGLMWQRNEISIAQEHLATGISQLVMARLFEYVTPVERNGKTIAVACVEGERHEFPARLVADYLDFAGFEVRHFGADLPTDCLVAEIARLKPDAIALSATMSFNVPALRRTVEGLRAAVGPTLPILIGGHALSWSPGLADELGVVTADAEPERVVAAMQQLTNAGN